MRRDMCTDLYRKFTSSNFSNFRIVNLHSAKLILGGDPKYCGSHYDFIILYGTMGSVKAVNPNVLRVMHLNITCFMAHLLIGFFASSQVDD